MTHAGFEVRPLARYDGARYPSAHAPRPRPRPAPEDPEADKSPRAGLWVQALACLFAWGVMIGVVACGTDPQSLICTLPACQDDKGTGDDDPEKNKSDCAVGTVWCATADLLATCLDGTTTAYQSCEGLCDQQLGTVDAYSLGCNADAADPCQCRYDAIDGGMPFCDPSEMYCAGDTLMLCAPDSGNFVAVDCDAECAATLGPGAYSEGCDVNAEDPCQCAYDMVPGVMVQCTPGEVVCSDPQTLAECGDDYTYAYTDCDERCLATYGYGAYSLGCDSAADDPCQCEYDMIAGDMPACFPEDVFCLDDDTVQTCVDYWPEVWDCDDYCQTTVGPSSVSSGCDDSDPEDPCGCS